MENVSRRQALARLAASIAASSAGLGCPRTGPEPPSPSTPKWKGDAQKWWEERQKQRQREREAARERGEPRGRVQMPRPYLECTSAFGPQVRNLALNETGEVSFTVFNRGNAPSWSCYVELYEGPGFTYSAPLSAYRLTGRKIITIIPGQRIDVKLPWQPTRATNGRILGVTYDPILDPRNFTVVEQFNRQITAVDWRRWGGD